jgi:hypothetical protein
MAPRPSATDPSDTADDGGPTMSTGLGARFVAAIAAQDPVALKAVLAPDVAFRALTPGRFWEADNADVLVDEVILGTWFAPDRSITAILGLSISAIGNVHHFAYRFRAKRPEGDFLIEQQAYVTATDGRISRLQILCSGFVPQN